MKEMSSRTLPLTHPTPPLTSAAPLHSLPAVSTPGGGALYGPPTLQHRLPSFSSSVPSSSFSTPLSHTAPFSGAVPFSVAAAGGAPAGSQSGPTLTSLAGLIGQMSPALVYHQGTTII